MGIPRSSSSWACIFIMTWEDVGTIYNCGLAIFGGGIVNKITEHLLGNWKYFVYSYKYRRTLDCPAGRHLFSTDGSLVHPILNYDTGSAMDLSVNVAMNAIVPIDKEYKARFKW